MKSSISRVPVIGGRVIGASYGSCGRRSTSPRAAAAEPRVQIQWLWSYVSGQRRSGLIPETPFGS